MRQTTFVFKNDAVLQSILLWTVERQGTCRKPYGNGELTKEPCVWLVKDSGAYLMACTSERQFVNPKDEEATRCVVAYAVGCRPEDGHIGGDDYAEAIPLKLLFCTPLGRRLKAFIITVSPTHIQVDYAYAKARKPKVKEVQA